MDSYDVRAKRRWLMALFPLTMSFTVFLVLYLAIFPILKVGKEASLLISLAVATFVFVNIFYLTVGKLNKGRLATISYDGIQFYNNKSYFLPWGDVQEVYFKSYIRVVFNPEKSGLPGIPTIHFLPKPGLESKYGIGSYKNVGNVYLVPVTAIDLRLVGESRQELNDLVVKYSKNQFQVGEKPKHYV